MILPDGPGARKFVIRAARENGGGLFVRDLGLTRIARKLVATLEEQPLLLLLVRARAHAHEVPAPLQPLPV